MTDWEKAAKAMEAQKAREAEAEVRINSLFAEEDAKRKARDAELKQKFEGVPTDLLEFEAERKEKRCFTGTLIVVGVVGIALVYLGRYLGLNGRPVFGPCLMFGAGGATLWLSNLLGKSALFERGPEREELRRRRREEHTLPWMGSHVGRL